MPPADADIRRPTDLEPSPAASAMSPSGAEQALRFRLEFEHLILSISTSFIDLAGDRIDAAIDAALERVGRFMGVDRSYVFRIDRRLMSNTHEWCAEGIGAERQRLQQVPLDTAVPYFARVIRGPAVFHVPCVAELPPEAAAEQLEFAREGIESLVCVPMVRDAATVGFLGFDAVRRRTSWSEDALALLRFCGEIFLHALARQQSEAVLRESEEKFRTLAEHSPNVIFIHRHGGLVYANERCLAVLGYSPEELCAPDFDFGRMLTPASRLVIGANFARHGRGEEVPPYECAVSSKDGRRIDTLISTRLITYEGAPAVMGIVTDITERKRFEAELQKAQQLESIGVLAGGIAHDFNNIVGAILGNVSLAREKLGPGHPVATLLEEAERACVRSRDLTKPLLTFAKGGGPARRALSLADVVRDAALVSLSGTRVKATLELAPDLWPVDADESQLLQVVQNLLINAAQAMSAGGTVSLRACNAASPPSALRPGHYVELAVHDHGVGIAREHVSRIFDPYFTTKRAGSGLGLAIVYSIVRNHQGHIAVVSEPGAGTTFTVYLPAAAAGLGAASSSPAPAPAAAGRVLVMDDNAAARKVTGLILREVGHSVVTVADGDEAIAAFTQARRDGAPFDVVILDLTVPGGLGGLECVRALRAIDERVLAIVASGYHDDAVVAHHRAHGFDEVLNKPFTADALVGAVARVLAGRAAAR